MCRRFFADAKDYSINNFNNIVILHIRVQNECVQDCVDEIRKIIKAKK